MCYFQGRHLCKVSLYTYRQCLDCHRKSKSKECFYLQVVLEARSSDLDVKKRHCPVYFNTKLWARNYSWLIMLLEAQGLQSCWGEGEWERKSTKSSCWYCQQWNRTWDFLDKLCTSYYCIMCGSLILRQELSHTWSAIWHWQRWQCLLAA